MSPHKLLLTVFCIVAYLSVTVHSAGRLKNQLKRKSIVFDPNTPDVFYCPQDKPTSSSKMIVRARPLDKLCEYGGNKWRPDPILSDCYNDVDETEYACEEKKRFLVRLKVDKFRDKTSNEIKEVDIESGVRK